MAQTVPYHHAFARNPGWVAPAGQSPLEEQRIAGLGGVGGHRHPLRRLAMLAGRRRPGDET